MTVNTNANSRKLGNSVSKDTDNFAELLHNLSAASQANTHFLTKDR